MGLRDLGILAFDAGEQARKRQGCIRRPGAPVHPVETIRLICPHVISSFVTFVLVALHILHTTAATGRFESQVE